VIEMLGRRLRLAVIGGGPGGFIGAIHRNAARLDDRYELVAGASGALDRGFDVISDKPITNTLDEALDLVDKVRRTGLIFCLTHNYSGYPMVRQARAMVEDGQLGETRLVQVECVHGGKAGEDDPDPAGGPLKQARARGVQGAYPGSVTVQEWLLEGDPAIRWQVMQDLTNEPAERVAAERARVASEGWGARLLALQDVDGQWGGGAYSPKWTSTTYTLLLLRHLGLDPQSDPARTAVGRVRERVVLGRLAWPFFAYRGETCITGMSLALAAYFGEGGEASDEVAGWLLSEQLSDGGWNCDTVNGSKRSSFNTTISALEGLLEYEQAKGGRTGAVTAARARAEEYLVARRMFRSLTTGEVVSARWKLFSFPPRWHYDVLRGLDYLQSAGAAPDDRCDEAIDLVESKRRSDGRWPLQNSYRGKEHFQMELGPGQPSRWNTLRALRVLNWYRRDRDSPGGGQLASGRTDIADRAEELLREASFGRD